MTDTTKKILYGAGIFIVIVVFLWGAWALVGSGGNTSSKPVVIPIDQTDHITGNPKSNITFVEFSDFQCPACKAYVLLAKQLNEKYKSKVRFVYKHFPLPIHNVSQPAALAAIAASKQGKFWEMHDLLFDKQEKWSVESDPKKFFVNYAKQLKLDIKQFEKDMESKESKTKMENDLTLGNQIGVNATPSFYINGKKIQAPQTLDEFSKIIDRELKTTQ
ncbi:hypothetical protein A2957_01820 [Candidatus Roizmanbacteria bacterium RIFCSPLOWO2_01_FULL_38_11]|uniref:Thioredoxin domain-containing protein n=1 Tax=Candidatus Roizmanbacteria bacterium RIFCSPLOWO2_01_FULL_38_11 TaxID=1802060 RepID=A0A1F7IL26_9BACT|nr:MAG: hypothetical protein A2957_01820 [Candidatus Roizmanbacteria bacterium RIFCSPLOWO2_01_FULL_38_11]